MNWFYRAWWFTLAIKIVLATVMPLASDEAYYWFWSHHLQFSYFDHPPMVAVLMWLGQPFENGASAVRIPGVIVGHATLLVWYVMLRNRLNDSSLKLWFALSLLTPLVGFGSLVITPDIPVLFFWALSLLCFERSLETKSAKWYAALGLALGLGFCSKYHIVLLVPVFLMHLSFEKKWREVAFRYLPLTILTGLMGCAPVLYWNATNEWASFLFQLKHGFGRDYYKFEWTAGYVVGQALLVGLVLIPALIRGSRDKNMRLFAWNVGFSWTFFLYSSFKSVVEANWPIVAYHSANALIARGSKSSRWVIGTCAFWIVCTFILLSHWVYPWIPNTPEKMDETHQYKSLARLVDQYSPIYANTYQMASLLSFTTKKEVLKLNGMSRYDYFDEIPESRPTSGSFYLIRRKGQQFPPWLSDLNPPVEVVQNSPPDFEVVKVTLP